MLHLGRKEQERILIGDDVVIIVLHIGRGQVKLGIEAPGQIIDREEVRVRRERKWKD